MPSEWANTEIAVFDLGGTWFRWGRYSPSRGLIEPQRVPAISYLSHPHLSADALQRGLADFVIRRTRQMRDEAPAQVRVVSVSIGAPVNAHNGLILGSGPLWGPAAEPFQLQACLRETMPELDWYVVNDITALLAPYMDESVSFRKTLLITVSTGVGGRLYDHRTRRIPYDLTHGIQGEIGHLVLTFELDAKVINRQCECGGWNHLNAFASGRGIAGILEDLFTLSSHYGAVFCESPDFWQRAGDGYRLNALKARLDESNGIAVALLDALVAPVSRTLAAALSLDPEIDRIVITGGVVNGLGIHYRDALHRVFDRDMLYQITPRDPQYLVRRLHWAHADDFGGLRGAGIYADMHACTAVHTRN